VEHKLVDEQIYRYMTLERLGEVLKAFANVGRGSDEFIDTMEKQFIKHRKGLTPEIVENVKAGFLKMNKGSEILGKVLADPTTKLPELEA